MTICTECRHCVSGSDTPECAAPSLEKYYKTYETDPVTGVKRRAAWGIGIRRIYAPIDGHFACFQINDGNCEHFEAKPDDPSTPRDQMLTPTGRRDYAP